MTCNNDKPGTAAEYMTAVRERYGLTLDELADIAGVTTSTAYRWSTGTRPNGTAVLAVQAWAEMQRRDARADNAANADNTDQEA